MPKSLDTNKNQKKSSRSASNVMDKIVSLAKRRGFVYPGSEIYGGLAGMWDYGPLGVALKNNIRDLWWQTFVLERDDMYGIDSAILMNAQTWEASGHKSGFTDQFVECKKCKKRFRADHIRPDLEESRGEDEGREKVGPLNCPDCGGDLSEERKFNMMFKTEVGATSEGASTIYLRPETAQGMFVNFKNIIDSYHPKLPFGIAQIGKSFRNEIAPRDFLFRAREFEIMEFEYFVTEKEWKKHFENWKKEMWKWIDMIGLSRKHVHEVEVPEGDRAHYSKRTVDFEYDFPFGKKELYGLAYRTDFDLMQHSKESGTELIYLDQGTGEKFVPHVIEPTFGLDRTVLAVLSESYTEDELGGEKRVFLKLPGALSPIKVAVFPLLKNKPELVKKAQEVYTLLKKEFADRRIGQVMFDDNGNIGKRYRRQDEIGTPATITVDFETLENDTVTVRDRDSGKQERVAIRDLTKKLKYA